MPLTLVPYYHYIYKNPSYQSTYQNIERQIWNRNLSGTQKLFTPIEISSVVALLQGQGLSGSQLSELCSDDQHIRSDYPQLCMLINSSGVRNQIHGAYPFPSVY